MQIHQLKRKTQNKKSVSVGRGGKRGKTSGRGTKGQKARAGRKIRPEMRDVIKRLPKLRGRGVNSFKSIEEKAKAVNIEVLEAAFNAGETVSPTTLVEKGVLEVISGKYPKVKILSDGDITKKLTITGCLVSGKAKEKIEKAGGAIQ